MTDSYTGSTLQSEREFAAPLVDSQICAKAFPFVYSIREDLPQDVLGGYIHYSITGNTAFILNRTYFGDAFEVRASSVVWSHIMEFHLRVLAGEVGPPPGDQFIWRSWYWRECATHILCPPHPSWILPISKN